MADVEFHEEMVPSGGAPTSVGNTARARGQISESITVGTGGFSPTRDEPAGRVEQESVTIGKRGGVALSERAQKMLANIDKHGTVSDDAPTVTVADDSPPAAEAPAAAVTPAQEQTPPAQSPPAATAAPSPTAPVTSTEDAIARQRLETANRELVTQLEQLKARPTRGEPSAREKALDEAERSILEDSVGAIRKVYMTALGVDDPKHPQVDKFMTWLYHDLTEHELSVPLDPSVKALRESERNLALRARDKRDAAAEAQKPEPTEQFVDPDTAAKVPIVARMIAQGDHATKYPLFRALSEDFDGMKPEALLWNEIRRGLQTGEYANPLTQEQDTQLIDLASRKIESHYQALADKIAKARPSTATPTPAAVATDSKADPQATGVRTITNASASVAPATTPAAKPAPTTTTPSKPWRNERERIRWLAAKHAGESG